MIGIYVLEFSNGMKYIGQSNNIPRRIAEHMEDMNGVHKNKKIRQCVFTCGLPTWRVLEECTLSELNAKEIHWIRTLDTFRNGCNQTIGGGYPRKLPVATQTTFPPVKSPWPVKLFIAAFALIALGILCLP